MAATYVAEQRNLNAASATRVQAAYRGQLCRREARREAAAATQVQAIHRGRLSRRPRDATDGGGRGRARHEGAVETAVDDEQQRQYDDADAALRLAEAMEALAELTESKPEPRT